MLKVAYFLSHLYVSFYRPKFHLARLDTTRHVRLCRASRASRDERVERDECVEPCFSNMADDEEAVVLACTSLVFCTLSVHVNKTEKRQHAVWVKDYLKKERLLDATILF